MSRRSKNHHFVPKVLQKAFAAEDDEIWHARRGKDERFSAPTLKNIKKTFVLSNYYTVLEGDEMSDVVERVFYGKVDSYLGKLLPDVLKNLGENRVPTFSGEPLDSLRSIVLEMIKRTPEFTGKYDDIQIGREIVEGAISDCGEYPNHQEEKTRLEQDLTSLEKLRDIGRSVRVKAVISRSEKLEDTLSKFSVRWAISDTHHSFILSSLIAYRIGNGGSNGLENSNMEIWMPISPKHAIVLLRDPQNKIPLVVTETPTHIREVNEYAARNAQHIASHSKKLLESLTKRKARVFERADS